MAMGENEPELNINFHGKQFTGSTVGIVGMGRIGLTGNFTQFLHIEKYFLLFINSGKTSSSIRLSGTLS